MNAGGWVFPGPRSIHTEACGKGPRDFACKGSLSTHDGEGGQAGGEWDAIVSLGKRRTVEEEGRKDKGGLRLNVCTCAVSHGILLI
jgi:hypothetical protein